MEPETDKHQNEKCESAAGTKQRREIFEESACQAYRENSLGQVAYKFTDIFLRLFSVSLIALTITLVRLFVKGNLIHRFCDNQVGTTPP